MKFHLASGLVATFDPDLGRLRPGRVYEHPDAALVERKRQAGLVVLVVAPAGGAAAADGEARSPANDGTYHATRGSVYHTCAACPVGNNIEPAFRRPGTGGLPPCGVCVAPAAPGATSGAAAETPALTRPGLGPGPRAGGAKRRRRPEAGSGTGSGAEHE